MMNKTWASEQDFSDPTFIRGVYSIMLISCISLLSLSCKGKIDPNEPIVIADDFFQTEEYTAQVIGWTVEIPINLEVTTKVASNTIKEKGRKIMEKLSGEAVVPDSIQNLIGFKLNESNFFRSHIEPFQATAELEWENHNQNNKHILFAAYKDLGFGVDSSKTTVTRIHELDFASYSLTLYDVDTNLVQNQVLFFTLINDLNFTANITTTTEANKKLLLNIWQSSRFRKKLFFLLNSEIVTKASKTIY